MGKIQVIPNLIFFRGGLIFPHLRNHNESASSGSNLLEDQGKGKRRKKIHTIFGIKNYILLENPYPLLFSLIQTYTRNLYSNLTPLHSPWAQTQAPWKESSKRRWPARQRQRWRWACRQWRAWRGPWSCTAPPRCRSTSPPAGCRWSASPANNIEDYPAYVITPPLPSF